MENPIEKVLKTDKIDNYEMSFENYFNPGKKPTNLQKHKRKEVSVGKKLIFKKKPQRADRFEESKNNKLKLMIKKNAIQAQKAKALHNSRAQQSFRQRFSQESSQNISANIRKPVKRNKYVNKNFQGSPFR